MSSWVTTIVSFPTIRVHFNLFLRMSLTGIMPLQRELHFLLAPLREVRKS